MRAIEFYSGVGGFSLGMKRAGFKVCAAFEIDDKHIATYKSNFPDTTVVKSDISQLEIETINHFVETTNVDLVFGGPPCQGFSTGGKQVVTDERNSLILKFAELVIDIEPRGFVMENVSGILHSKFKNILSEFYGRLKKRGYTIHPPLILNAKDFNVPQDRKRVFFFGFRKKNPKEINVQPIRDNLLGSVNIHDALADILHINLTPNTSDIYAEELGHSTLYSVYLRNPDYENEYPVRELTGCMTTEHSVEVIQRFRKTQQGEVEPISRYKRLHLNGVSPTLRAGTIRGKGQFMAPRPIHPIHSRCITTREAARIHSYPDWFKFHPTKWYGMMQIGNSVPPHLGEAVGNIMFEILA